jgi:DNA-binding NarL/FixJ family response regulator
VPVRILIVEDDAFRILLFRQWLRGHDLAVAETARRAIRLLRRQAFDVVFLDHDLGGRVLVDPADPNTGAEVARFMARQGVATRTIIHSHSPDGTGYLKTLLPTAEVVPFGADLRERLPELLVGVKSEPPGPPALTSG